MRANAVVIGKGYEDSQVTQRSHADRVYDATLGAQTASSAMLASGNLTGSGIFAAIGVSMIQIRRDLNRVGLMVGTIAGRRRRHPVH